MAVAVALVALVAGLFAFASAHQLAGVVSVVLAVLVGGGGMGWLALAHRKVRDAERCWHAEHPSEMYRPPTS